MCIFAIIIPIQSPSPSHHPPHNTPGENNCGGVMGNSKDHDGYGCELAAMVALWREQWDNPNGPFGVVTLAAGGSEGHGANMAGMRWSQTANYGTMPNAAIPNSFVAQAFDLADPWQNNGATDRNNCSHVDKDTGKVRVTPSHILTLSHPRPLTLSPSHPLALSPSHPLTLSPSHPLSLSPSRPLTLSPSLPPSTTRSAPHGIPPSGKTQRCRPWRHSFARTKLLCSWGVYTPGSRCAGLLACTLITPYVSTVIPQTVIPPE
jgi:hypothetical protein